MQLEFKINAPINIFNTFEMYRQIICSESGLSEIMGLNVYGFHVENNSDNFTIESYLPCSQNTFLISNPDYPSLKSLLPLHYSGIKKNLNLFLLLNNFYWEHITRKLYKDISYEYICSRQLIIEDILKSPVDSLEATQYYIMKCPLLKDRKIKIEKEEDGYSVLLVDNSLEELFKMEKKFCKIISDSNFKF